VLFYYNTEPTRIRIITCEINPLKLRIEFLPQQSSEEISIEHLATKENSIYIKDPYVITMIEGSRRIVGSDSTVITYEKYILELEKIIQDKMSSKKLDEEDEIDSIIIEGFKDGLNFRSLCNSLSTIKLALASVCNISFRNCSFSGNLYVNPVLKLVKSVEQHGHKVIFNIFIHDESKSSLISEHDKARLTVCNNIILLPDNEPFATIRHFKDDQILGTRNKSLLALSAPSYFFKTQHKQSPAPQTYLLNFFSQFHQQQTDYTCGPAALKMIADYYCALNVMTFCEDCVDTNWKIFNNYSEFKLAEYIDTTEAVGSEMPEMREGLTALGLSVIDDSDGLNVKDNNESDLKNNKLLRWHQFKKIFNLGIPIIINLRDRGDVGHYAVAIGINSQEQIILSEPGTALTGKPEFEIIRKKELIRRWKNMTGERHGRFLIPCPNEISAKNIDIILQDVPHYFNGEKTKISLSQNK
jgi:hypothetical protein